METPANWLDALLEHELACARMLTAVEQTPRAWFLHNPELGRWHDANHALRLRDDGNGPESVAAEVVAYYRSRNLPPIADVDEIAEGQGIGTALRRMGVTPVVGDRQMMTYPHASSPDITSGGVEVRRVLDETGPEEVETWIKTTVCEEEEHEDYPLFLAATKKEAESGKASLYLGYLGGQAVGSCYLFSSNGWARVESVVTRPGFRRRGVASSIVARAVADSLAAGNRVTYLYTDSRSNAERLYSQLGWVPFKLNPLRRHLG